jgi:hypothetical protein
MMVKPFNATVTQPTVLGTPGLDYSANPAVVVHLLVDFRLHGGCDHVQLSARNNSGLL